MSSTLSHTTDPELQAATITSVQDLKTSILSKSALVPGFSTLLQNLLSSGVEVIEPPEEGEDPNPAPEWMQGYTLGAAHGIYTVPLDRWAGTLFPALALGLWSKAQVVLFAVETNDGKEREILFNPCERTLGSSDVGFVIARTQNDAWDLTEDGSAFLEDDNVVELWEKGVGRRIRRTWSSTDAPGAAQELNPPGAPQQFSTGVAQPTQEHVTPIPPRQCFGFPSSTSFTNHRWKQFKHPFLTPLCDNNRSYSIS